MGGNMMTERRGLDHLPLIVRASRRHSMIILLQINHQEASSFDFHSDALLIFFETSLSPMTSVPALSPVSGALSPVRADLIPSPKRVRDSGCLAEVEVDPRETSLRDDVIVGVSDEPQLEQDSDPEVQAEIDECFAYA
ncbi:hypothetical protein Tco_1509131 [Tanacetum coccineum]